METFRPKSGHVLPWYFKWVKFEAELRSSCVTGKKWPEKSCILIKVNFLRAQSGRKAARWVGVGLSPELYNLILRIFKFGQQFCSISYNVGIKSEESMVIDKRSIMRLN